MTSVVEAAVTGEVMLERARQLASTLRERAAKAEEMRRIPDETIGDLKALGFFRVVQPKRFGGYELDPLTIFQLQLELGKHCPSTAWVYGVLCVHTWQLSLFPEAAQQAIWGVDPGTLISSSYAPVGRVSRVEGGYKISGRWSFSSGSDHCAWVFLGGFVPPDAEFTTPDMRTFAIPRGDYQIVDTWHVSGLKATGSHDIVVEDAFVPEHLTHRFNDGFKTKSPGNKVNKSVVYRYPFGQIHVRSVSTPAVGAAKGLLEGYLDWTSKKVATSDKSKVSEDPTSQMVAAEAAATLDEVELVLNRNFTEMRSYLDRGEAIPVERRAKFRYDSSRAVARAVEVADKLFTQSGGRALFLRNSLQRYWQDVHAIRQHFANNPDKPGRNYGRVQLGLPNQDFFI